MMQIAVALGLLAVCVVAVPVYNEGADQGSVTLLQAEESAGVYGEPESLSTSASLTMCWL